MERNMHRWFQRQVWSKMLPEPFEFDINFKRNSGMGTYTGKTSVLLPHEVFNNIHKNAIEVFHYIFVGVRGNLDYFWEKTVATDPEFVDNHPVCQSTPAHLRVPIGMHGDDAGIFEHEKASDSK
jgi:hypothetical protein